MAPKKAIKGVKKQEKVVKKVFINKKEPESQQNEIQQKNKDSPRDNQQSSNSEDESGQQGESVDEQSDGDDQDSSSQEKVAPQNYAIKQMKFRQRRGTKMNYLINRKKEEEEDPFWANHQNYFGDLGASDDQEEDYVQSSSGRDYFDSDFGNTQSQHDDQQQDDGKPKPQQFDEDQQKQRKRQHQLLMKIKHPQSQPNRADKNIKKKNRHIKKNISEEFGNRYIHQLFTQQQLLGQAAHTQYFNWLSYRQLISMETVKKDYVKKKHHLEGDKIVYRDKMMENGKRQVSYQLNGVIVNKVEDLTELWKD